MVAKTHETQNRTMRHVPLERDINIAVNGCSGFANSTQKEPFMAMLTSRSRGTHLIKFRSSICRVCTACLCKKEGNRPSDLQQRGQWRVKSVVAYEYVLDRDPISIFWVLAKRDVFLVDFELSYSLSNNMQLITER